MRIKEIQLQKYFKKGLPNYSNLTVGMSLTVDIPENEEPDYNSLWDIINQQLTIQSNSNDQSWLETSETKDAYKFTIKTLKKGGEQ